MNPEIKYGIFSHGDIKVVLSSVSAWKNAGQTIVFFLGGFQLSVMTGAKTPEADALIAKWFSEQ